ncbi:MAG: VWA domain-containing protein, partial [Snowella sp.]
ASSGQFDLAFQKAEKAISSLVEGNLSGDYGLVFGTLRIGIWTGLLSLGTALALIIGQNYYLHRHWLSFKDVTLGIIGGFMAGLIAGAIGQLIFLPMAEIPSLNFVGRVIGWTILGMLVGGGMSFFVTNLKLNRAVIGGIIGGLGGAIGFLGVTGIFGEIIARLLGAGILGFFIGLMIAWMEQISRKSWLVVHWTPNEQTTISLGNDPVLLGSAKAAHIYLSPAHGFHPKTAKIYQEGDTIVMQYEAEYGTAKGMKKLRQELKNGDQRKLGQITVEVKTSTEKKG